eukprot:3959372-Pyramimonas_sp.AAC.1
MPGPPRSHRPSVRSPIAPVADLLVGALRLEVPPAHSDRSADGRALGLVQAVQPAQQLDVEALQHE